MERYYNTKETLVLALTKIFMSINAVKIVKNEM